MLGFRTDSNIITTICVCICLLYCLLILSVQLPHDTTYGNVFSNKRYSPTLLDVHAFVVQLVNNSSYFSSTINLCVSTLTILPPHIATAAYIGRRIILSVHLITHS